MEQLYKFLGYNRDFENIDLTSILSKFEYEIADEVSHADRTSVKPLTNNTGALFWQKYPPGLAFARNFYIHNKDVCNAVTNILISMQHNINEGDDYLSNFFRNIRIDARSINLIRVSGAVQAHRDVTRNYSLSIGMDNSADYETYITSCPNLEEYSESMRQYYTVGRNEVYITAVKYVHGVIPISDDIKTVRYIFTYNIV